MPKPDKRIEKSTINIHVLRELLRHIISHPKDFTSNTDVRKALKSQGGTASLSISLHINGRQLDKNPTSLNSLKQHANEVFDGGFGEINSLRLEALSAIERLETKKTEVNKRTKDGLQNKVKDLEARLADQRIANLIILQALSSAMSSFKSIRDAPNKEVREKRATDAIRTITSIVGMNQHPLNSIPDSNTVINLKDYQT